MPAKVFYSGIIEGFYGRPWSTATRLAYAGYLQNLGLNTCIYCPKGDPYLRKQWQRDWLPAQWRQLQCVSTAYRQQGLHWGVGLSPFALYQHYGAGERRQLRDKVARLLELQPSILAILFDDMPGNLADLGGRQAEIINDVCHWAPAVQILVCPTYYAFDPVLEKHFGPMPEGYWRQLGRDLPPQAGVFWTGNQVCSTAVTVADIRRIAQQIERPMVLWDNYPVNDGALRSRYLYAQPLAQREPGLGAELAGHLCNPMNQGLLSLPALLGLARLYGSPIADEGWLPGALGPATWQALQGHRDEFQQQGLDGMGEQRCLELARHYQGIPGAAATEVAAWLRGEYTFDASCLTD